jgi:hypothetical protein
MALVITLPLEYKKLVNLREETKRACADLIELQAVTINKLHDLCNTNLAPETCESLYLEFQEETSPMSDLVTGIEDQLEKFTEVIERFTEACSLVAYFADEEKYRDEEVLDYETPFPELIKKAVKEHQRFDKGVSLRTERIAERDEGEVIARLDPHINSPA